MEQSIYHYLSRVLGVQQINLMSLARSLESKTEQQPACAFYVFTPFEMSNEERDLAEKMLKVLEVKNISFIHNNCQDDFENHQGFGLSFGVAPHKLINIRWTEMESISSFVSEADPSKLQQSKRQAWEVLKNLKNEMKQVLNHRVEVN
ncbi:MAG: hypothetical protein ABL927_04830 [Bdellovibrionales bacterium]